GVAEDSSNEPASSHNSKPSSPGAANPSLSRIQTTDRASPASPGARRSKGNERSNVPTPTSGRSVSRTSSTSSVNSVQSQGSTGRATASSSTTSTTSARGKNHMTPEEEFKQKHQQVKSQHTVEANRLKSRLEEQRAKGTTQSTMGAKRGGAETDNRRQTAQTRSGTTTGRSPRSAEQQSRLHMNNGRSGGPAGKQPQGAVKMLEEYKDANPNFTIRRREEQTIESRLKVTLPDNLPEALRDGVVLCHLANQIRPRSVASIHVPSPAVPKLTLAKCRRNVENFLDACRKIGVDQKDLCTVDDVVESLRMTRITTAVVRLDAFPRLTRSDYCAANLCIIIIMATVFTLAEQICLAPDIMDERGVHRVAITVAALVAIGTNPRQSAV
ncbi:hypothetical protein BaRGS_00032765, partial [Batillaria attramentaria]